jgi:hypothetical protein
MNSEYFSDDNKRSAVIKHEDDAYIVTLYELDDPYRIYKDNEHNISYWEDCCENFVNYWGEFKK